MITIFILSVIFNFLTSSLIFVRYYEDSDILNVNISYKAVGYIAYTAFTLLIIIIVLESIFSLCIFFRNSKFISELKNKNNISVKEIEYYLNSKRSMEMFSYVILLVICIPMLLIFSAIIRKCEDSINNVITFDKNFVRTLAVMSLILSCVFMTFIGIRSYLLYKFKLNI